MVDRHEFQFIEEMGALFERAALPRIAGRVWGYLLIVDAEQVSTNGLADALNMSLSSISTATRLLVALGMVNRIRVPGERSDYFTIHHGSILNLVRRPLETATIARDLADRALQNFGDRDVARPHLEELRDTYSWFAAEFPALVDRFGAERTPREE